MIGFDAAHVERRQFFAVGNRHQHAISHSARGVVGSKFDRDAVGVRGKITGINVVSVAYFILRVNRFSERGIGETEPRNDRVQQCHRLFFGVAGNRRERAARIINDIADIVGVGNAEHIRLHGVTDIRVSGVEHIGIYVVIDGNVAQERRGGPYGEIVVIDELVKNGGSIAEIGDRHVDIAPYGIGNVYRLLIIQTEPQRERVLDVIEVYRYLAELFFEGEVKHFRENGLKRRARDYYGNSALGELQTVEQSEIPVYRYGFFFILVTEIVPVSVAFRTFVSVGVSGSVGRSFDVGALLGSFLVAAAEQSVEQPAELRYESVKRSHDAAYGIAERSAESIEQLS